MAVMPCAGLLPCVAMAGQGFDGFLMHSILRAEAHSQTNTMGSGVCAGKKAAAESCGDGKGWMAEKASRWWVSLDREPCTKTLTQE